jgi:hypothetical protein
LLLSLLRQIIDNFNVFSGQIESPPDGSVDAEPEDEDEDAEENRLEDLELRPWFGNYLTHLLFNNLTRCHWRLFFQSQMLLKLDGTHVNWTVPFWIFQLLLLIRNLACINNALINTREQHFIFVFFFLFFLSFF